MKSHTNTLPCPPLGLAASFRGIFCATTLYPKAGNFHFGNAELSERSRKTIGRDRTNGKPRNDHSRCAERHPLAQLSVSFLGNAESKMRSRPRGRRSIVREGLVNLAGALLRKAGCEPQAAPLLFSVSFSGKSHESSGPRGDIATGLAPGALATEHGQSDVQVVPTRFLASCSLSHVGSSCPAIRITRGT